jgi:glycosyltransferase involved in cell wall biosynthesis
VNDDINGSVEMPYLQRRTTRFDRAGRTRVLIHSHVFAPSVGGSESACSLLADGLLRRGCEVRVVTNTPTLRPIPQEALVFRQPGTRQLYRLVQWADVVVHSNISLRVAWPLLLGRKPWVIIHHSLLTTTKGTRRFREWLKIGASFLATNIAVSRSTAASLMCRTHVIANGYRDRIFRSMPGTSRDRDLIFVGRLVPSKGVDTALRILARLRGEGLRCELTIVGGGPCDRELRELAASLGIADAVHFHGFCPPEQIARALNEHKVLLAPSRGVETFGLVAIEALACGCVPLVSAVGGLAETVKNHGVVVPENDITGFVRAARLLLQSQEERDLRVKGVEAYLERFHEQNVVDAYAEVIEGAVPECSPQELTKANLTVSALQ